MPETRYTEEYEQGTGKLLRKIPYEVSDEQLARESRGARLREAKGKTKKMTLAELAALVDDLVQELMP